MPKSLKELMNIEMASIWESNGYFYFLPKTNDKYDHCVFKVKKGSDKVEYFDMLDFMLDVQDKAKQISLKEVKEGM